MDSDIQLHSQQQQQQQQQMNSGLMRYRSAPSSYFAGIFDGGDSFDHFLRSSSPETERILSGFVSGGGGGGGGKDDESSHNFCKIEPNSSANETGTKHQEEENGLLLQQREKNAYSVDVDTPSQMIYRNQAQPSHQDPTACCSSSMNDSYKQLATSLPMDQRFQPVKMMTGGSNLMRQSSSPAGFLSYLSSQNDYSAVGEDININRNDNKRLKSQAFSSAPSSSTGIMATIPEGMPQEGGFDEDHKRMSSLPIGSWDDSTILSGSFLDGLEDEDIKPVVMENQIGDEGSSKGMRPPNMLSHHLSLPQSAMEKLLQFQDSVPCKIRAKRGCATHPRSIAERVRRTRISERMRRLQDLVPNMDKQTNTSDMLDLAVDYIKVLQRQVKSLADSQSKCKCLNRQNQ